MEIIEKPPEAVKKEEKKAERKPERMLKLPEEAVKYLNRVIKREEVYRGFAGADSDLSILSSRDNPSSKYNKLLKRVLWEVLSTEIKNEVPLSYPKERSEDDVRGYLHKFFDEFFSPLINKGENEKKLEEYDKEKKELVPKLNWINQNPMFSKEKKKTERAPIENRLLELSRLRKQIEEQIKLKSAEKLLYFIPGYQKDFDEYQERIKETHPSES